MEHKLHFAVKLHFCPMEDKMHISAKLHFAVLKRTPAKDAPEEASAAGRQPVAADVAVVSQPAPYQDKGC